MGEWMDEEMGRVESGKGIRFERDEMARSRAKARVGGKEGGGRAPITSMGKSWSAIS